MSYYELPTLALDRALVRGGDVRVEGWYAADGAAIDDPDLWPAVQALVSPHAV